MASRSLEMGQFLGHTTKSGGGSQFLRGWRKRKPAVVNAVLHTKAPIVALWQHGMPRIFEQKDEKTGDITRRVFGGQFNCLEDESVLVKQYRRDRDTGERVLPPVICPVCRLLEALRSLYADGVIGFADDVFRWEGDVNDEEQTLTLGGMLNLYDSDKITDDEKAAMKDAGIKLSEAWKENTFSKCNYLFTIVDADEPETGIQLAIETTALGDATKECIHAKITSAGEEKGNPLVTPYAIQWQHHPNAKEFSKKYKAIAMERVAITPQIMELIESDPPDIDNIIRGGNVTKLRAELEARCVLKDPSVLDWDDIFGPAERAGFGDREEASDTEEATEEEAKPVEKPVTRTSKPAPAATAKPTAKPAHAKAEVAPATAPSTGRRRKAEPEPEPEPEPEEAPSHEDNTIPCDECGAPMAADATRCEACGAEYEMDDTPEEAAAAPEPPPKPATKPAAKPATPATAAPAKGKSKIPF